MSAPRAAAPRPNSCSRWSGNAVRNPPKMRTKTRTPEPSVASTTGSRSATPASRNWSRTWTEVSGRSSGSSRHTAAAAGTPTPYSMRATRQWARSAMTPPIDGASASASVNTAALRPMRAVRCSPSQWSLMSTTARLMSPAVPNPWSRRAPTSTSNVGAEAATSPNPAKASRHGVSTRRRPYRSASSPMIGATTTPGSEPAATMNPAPDSDRPRSSRMSGIDGPIRVLLRMPVTVMAKISSTGGRTDVAAGRRAPGFPDRITRRPARSDLQENTR